MLRKDIIRPLNGGRVTADPSEVARFDELAQEWWKPDGKFKTVHAFNAARVSYICDRLLKRFGGETKSLAGVRVLDVGCGAGLVTEPIARLGADVSAIDASARSVEIARRHAAQSGLDIDYRCATPDEIDPEEAAFDAVLSLEVVEHVGDLPGFLSDIASLVRPGGLLAIGTLNRTPMSWATAIVGAEYVLGWLPKGTHDWRRFVTPEELIAHLEPHGLTEHARQGVIFNPFRLAWTMGRSTKVNYIQTFIKSDH